MSQLGKALNLCGVLPCLRNQLNLRVVLTSGQSFRWHERKAGEFTGVMQDTVWTLSQTDDQLIYKVHGSWSPGSEVNKLETAGVLSGSVLSNTTSIKSEIGHVDNLLCGSEKNHAADVGLSSTCDVLLNAEVKSERRSCRKRLRASNHGVTDALAVNSESIVASEVDSDMKDLLTGSLPCVDVVSGSHSGVESGRMYEEMLRDYFQLDVDLDQLYSGWADRDLHFKEAQSTLLRGVRLLRQEPVETLFAFICSSNNNISRISGMVDRLCVHFGHLITTVEGHSYYTFPSISRLSESDVESILRESGFGYRAKYLSQTAQALMQSNLWSHDCLTKELGQGRCTALNHSPPRCLCVWRRKTYAEARSALLTLQGVGPKVADCVCLMALDKFDVVPIDTHILQIASRDYSFASSKTKSLTDNAYRKIGDGFRDLWGPYAGWAQAVLFASEVSKSTSTLLEPNKKVGNMPQTGNHLKHKAVKCKK